jgi:hypothetical protein
MAPIDRYLPILAPGTDKPFVAVSSKTSNNTMERHALDLVVQLSKWVLYCELTGYKPTDPTLLAETRELLGRPVPPDETEKDHG